ncbi:MAG TPA: methylated-DNA--[protein]-cysteine S-methyltransferase [Chlamydiales bacterium]|nr:methylated-DNA--[protein]-cysteine S-methyltransferase [Chlamydiales bacterium]
MTNYQRIEKAISYINENFRQQPSLDEIAAQVHLSPFHFQRLFHEWAGVTPKKFLQYISLENSKQLLKQNLTLADTSFEAGLSGTSRLHDLFISIEGMTPGEFKNEGEALSIQYSFAETPFGDILIASTPKGICHISFADDPEKELELLHERFSKASFSQKTDMQQQAALQIFKKDWTDLPQIKLHLKASAFQLKVWEALLKIPAGSVSTYASVANLIQSPQSPRAVGTAIGSNPVAFLIPCHRVIRSTGVIGEYHWGTSRKTAMIGWEGVGVGN